MQRRRGWSSLVRGALFSLALLGLSLVEPPALLAQDEAAPRCSNLIGTPVCISQSNYVPDICAAIERLASHYDLPPGFFARLIWQESRFDPRAISPVGAQGIAQFMPGTADLRSLRDPFDPAEALSRSAEYLQFLFERFGNLGLAAAAYNGGEGRVQRLLAGTSGVAAETRAYVRIVTGRPVDYWTGKPTDAINYALAPDRPFDEACQDMARAVPMPDLLTATGEWQPWGVLIAQNFSPEIARAAFERQQARFPALFADRRLLFITGRNLSLGTRLRYSAQVGFPDRGSADAFCQTLRQNGGACIVQRNGD